MALPSSDRGGARVKWVALHTAEGSRRAADLYAFFNANQNASSHVGIDSTGFYDWVPRERYAWTLLNGNRVSVNAELCGFARWGRDQWLSTGTVDGVVNPRGMVRNAALWAKRECEALGIPKKYIGTDGVRAGQAGIIIHWDYSRGTGDGDHWDLGENFPWDVFFADMNGEADMPLNADDLLAVERRTYAAVRNLFLDSGNGDQNAITYALMPIIKKAVSESTPAAAPVTLSDEDRENIAAKVREGLVEDLAPLFELARRLKD